MLLIRLPKALSSSAADFARDDFRLVEPGRSPLRAGFADITRHQSPGGNLRCNRRKDIPAVKSEAWRRQIKPLKLVRIKMMQTKLRGLIQQRGEQTVVGRQEYMIVIFHDEYFPIGSHPRIDDGDVYRAFWKVLVRSTYPETGFRRPVRGNFMREIDDRRLREAS